MIKETRKIKTSFVSAPTGTRLDVLRESLIAHRIRPLVPSDLFPGNDWAAEIQDKLREADLVVAVLPGNRNTSWVLFELGQAAALGKKILLIASAKSDPIPLSIQHFLVLRTSPSNREAIDFALDQLLSLNCFVPLRQNASTSGRSVIALATRGTMMKPCSIQSFRPVKPLKASCSSRISKAGQSLPRDCE